jgi:hypothetical protein
VPPPPPYCFFLNKSLAVNHKQVYFGEPNLGQWLKWSGNDGDGEELEEMGGLGVVGWVPVGCCHHSGGKPSLDERLWGLREREAWLPTLGYTEEQEGGGFRKLRSQRNRGFDTMHA